LQLQSKGRALIFILKISNVWDSLISFGRVCHDFWPANLTVLMPYRFALALGETKGELGNATRKINWDLQ